MSSQPTNKTCNISFRLTEPQYAKLAQSASLPNMRPNQLARHLVITKSSQVTIKTHAAHDPALVRQLYFIGNNLNQITKAVHLGRISPQIESICEQIQTLMDEAIESKDAP